MIYVICYIILLCVLYMYLILNDIGVGTLRLKI